MKKLLKTNRIIATAALVIIIVLSLIAGVNRSIGSLADNVEEIYSEGTAKYGSQKDDMEKFCTYLTELYSLLPNTEDDMGLKASLDALQNVADTPFAEEDYLTPAFNVAQLAYNYYFYSAEQSGEQNLKAIECFAEIRTLYQRLKNNVPYEQAVKEYNEALTSFPASLIDFLHEPAIGYNNG